MALADQYNLATVGAFVQRVQAAIVAAGIAIYNEVANDVQTLSITGNPTGGTFTLTFGGQTTTTIAWNASAGTVQLALVALSSVGAGNVLCAGGPLPGSAVTITFQGTLAAAPQGLITVGTNSLTGGSSPAPSLAHTTTGAGVVNHTARAALASKVLANPGGYAQDLFSFGVATDANVQSDYLTGGPNAAQVTDAHINAAVSGQWNSYS